METQPGFENVLLWKYSDKNFPSDVITVEYFDGCNHIIYNIENELSFCGSEGDTAMSRSEATARFGLGVERRTIIIETTAAVEDSELMHLGRQVRLPLSNEQRLKLLRKIRKEFLDRYVLGHNKAMIT